MIVDWPEINVSLQRFASDPAGQHILSRIAEPFGDEDTGHSLSLT